MTLATLATDFCLRLTYILDVFTNDTCRAEVGSVYAETDNAWNQRVTELWRRRLQVYRPDILSDTSDLNCPCRYFDSFHVTRDTYELFEIVRQDQNVYIPSILVL